MVKCGSMNLYQCPQVTETEPALGPQMGGTSFTLSFMDPKRDAVVMQPRPPPSVSPRSGLKSVSSLSEPSVF